MVEKVKNKILDYRNIFRSLAVGVVILLGSYVYFVSHTVWSVVERQKAEHSIAALENGIEKLEAGYSKLKQTVTADLARSRGFSDISSAVFISRKPIGKGLSLNNEI